MLSRRGYNQITWCTCRRQKPIRASHSSYPEYSLSVVLSLPFKTFLLLPLFLSALPSRSLPILAGFKCSLSLSFSLSSPRFHFHPLSLYLFLPSSLYLSHLPSLSSLSISLFFKPSLSPNNSIRISSVYKSLSHPVS